ncbi:MAG: helix-turn-helix transcriptional regulator [Psychrilyobacter sp.]|uniref:helix-turn-helix domain-containing protein n=1 Tax=Psychrilyobacter sp. TaxID=2586924 RepID=UPI003C759D20
MKFSEYKKLKMEDKDFKEEYEKLGPEYEIISALIKARKEQKISQVELAKRAQTDQSHISRLERGSYNPSLNFLKKIADGLNMDIHISFEPKKI